MTVILQSGYHYTDNSSDVTNNVLAVAAAKARVGEKKRKPDVFSCGWKERERIEENPLSFRSRLRPEPIIIQFRESARLQVASVFTPGGIPVRRTFIYLFTHAIRTSTHISQVEENMTYINSDFDFFRFAHVKKSFWSPNDVVEQPRAIRENIIDEINSETLAEEIRRKNIRVTTKINSIWQNASFRTKKHFCVRLSVSSDDRFPFLRKCVRNA